MSRIRGDSPGPLRGGCIALALVVWAFGSGCGATPALEAEREVPKPRRGMVVAEHPLAAGIGAEVLERGGNAADAAVATALALAVVFPQAGNLGGGGFALWVGSGGKARVLDFREVAPGAADPALYLDASGRAVPERALSGPLAVGVPGSPSGLHLLHAELGSGRFTFESLALPAIRLARNGFRVDERLESTLAAAGTRARLSQNLGARELFYPGGEPLGDGDLLVQGALADTLERYARRGPDEFVTGPTAAALVAELARPGPDGPQPWITPEDLAAYEPAWREPLRGWFRGRRVITVPPPSSGGVLLLQTLAVLDGFPLEAERDGALARLGAGGSRRPDSDPSGLDERAVHWWIETLRLGFAERAQHLGDPEFHDVPLEALLSSEWVARSRVAIGDLANDEVVPTPVPEGTNTTHLSVLDSDGNAVSLTTTLNSSFGSGILVRGTGVLLNNELDDFALPRSAPNQFGLVGSEANRIQPGKRPLSSMTPTVVVSDEGAVELVLGSPGGPRIITSVIAVCLRTLVYGETLEAAVGAPRFHQQWSPTATEFEAGWPPALLEALERRGHEVREVDTRFGGIQAIQVLGNGEVVGVSDPRRLGGVSQTDRR